MAIIIRRVLAIACVAIAASMWYVLGTSVDTFHPDVFMRRESYAMLGHSVGVTPVYFMGWVAFIGLYIVPAFYLIPAFFLIAYDLQPQIKPSVDMFVNR